MKVLIGRHCFFRVVALVVVSLVVVALVVVSLVVVSLVVVARGWEFSIRGM